MKDNGKGFDTENVREGSFGLIGMKERIDLLKGTINISSVVGKGTTVLMKIPLPLEDDETI